jgi:hypothetical protein
MLEVKAVPAIILVHYILVQCECSHEVQSSPELLHPKASNIQDVTDPTGML